METINVISGLLTQKPEGRAPEQGEIKCYAIEQKVSKNGKPWTKARNSTPDKGGSNYRILNVQQTDFVDAHGNVSFNVELEAAPNGAQPSTPSSTGAGNGNPEPVYAIVQTKDAVKAAKAHLAKAANGMLFCLSAAQYIEIAWKKESGLDITPDQHQAITSTLFINLDKSGLIQSLPTSKPQPEGEEPPF